MSAGADPKKQEGAIASAIRFWLPVLILVLVVRTFLFQPFHIPSESMEETLRRTALAFLRPPQPVSRRTRRTS